MFRKLTLAFTAALFSCTLAARAHDTWLQTGTSITRVGEAVFVDYLMGNHGNEHRDFKIAGKPTVEGSTLVAIAPDGTTADLLPTIVDQGLAPKEGYLTARFDASTEGLYLIAQTSDKVVDYAPKRSVKSAKTFVLASRSLDKVPENTKGFDRVLGHALELVPLTNPVAPLGVGSKVQLRLLYKGKPLAGATVSFIPNGAKLKEGFDPKHEVKTDESGLASMEVNQANRYLVVAHHEDANDKGPTHDSTKYSATVTLNVPANCPCCGE